MIRQFKLILICTLVFNTCGIKAQDSLFYPLDVRIDSVHHLILLEIDQEVQAINLRFKKQLNGQNLLLDSMKSEIFIQKEAHRELIVENELLESKLAELNQTVEVQAQLIKEEHSRFKRILLISGPSILFLVLFSAVVFYLLIIKYKDQTEKRINALKKYTHSEIENSRIDLLNKLKKRIKKLSGTSQKAKKKSQKSKVKSQK